MKKGGFSLIELVIAVTIIGVLTTIGLTAFSGIQGKTRDAKRKADIDAIAKAYETKYDSNSSKYNQISATDFIDGIIPIPPEGGEYLRSSFGADNKANSFRVCAKLDAAPPEVTACPVTGHPEYCYCKQSSQAKFP